jgi:thymidylate kinase
VKILVLEGIATSGKSSVATAIAGQLKAQVVQVVSEDETHIPIKQRTEELHSDFFKRLIEQYIDKRPDLLIFDRLYLTQAFRASVSLDEYLTIEEILIKHGAQTIFLKVNQMAIIERLSKSLALRDPAWEEYVKTKGSNMTQIANYYLGQQQNQLSLLRTSKIPYKIFDTTTEKYQEIALQIIEDL